jgi:hypothetical protein
MQATFVMTLRSKAVPAELTHAFLTCVFVKLRAPSFPVISLTCHVVATASLLDLNAAARTSLRTDLFKRFGILLLLLLPSLLACVACTPGTTAHDALVGLAVWTCDLFPPLAFFLPVFNGEVFPASRVEASDEVGAICHMVFDKRIVPADCFWN